MGRTKELPEDAVNLGFRVPGALVARLDAYCGSVREQHGHTVSRSDAIRVLLDRALSAEGFAADNGKGRRGKRKD